MDSVAGVVAVAPVEGLASGGPVGLVVELAGVEHDLVHDLGDLDGVGGGASTAGLKGTGGRVGDVVLVVGRVGVLSVPAGWEGHSDTPAAAAGRSGEARDVLACAGGAAEGGLLHVGLAAEAKTTRHLLGIAVGRITDQHTEALGVGKSNSLAWPIPSSCFFLSLAMPEMPSRVPREVVTLTGLKAVTLALDWYPRM